MQNKSSQEMKILHVGDLHANKNLTDNQENVFKLIHEKAEDVDLVVMGGDFTDAGLNSEYQQFIDKVKSIENKLCLVRGNHEMNDMMKYCRKILEKFGDIQYEASTYKVFEWKASWWEDIKHTNKSFTFQQSLPDHYSKIAQAPVFKLIDGSGPYYRFIKNNYKFLVLDTCQWVLGRNQYAWLEKELQTEYPVIIFMHHTILPTGSIYDSAVLWNRKKFIDLLLKYNNVLGVFSGHVHYNKIWDVNGKKIVTTADRGGMREIILGDGKIQSIEHLANDLHKGTGAKAETPIEKDQEKFLFRNIWADETISPNTFNIIQVPKNIWGNACFGWHDSDIPGGLIWNIHNLGDEVEVKWFGINFCCPGKWRITAVKDGIECFLTEGKNGGNQVISGQIPFKDFKRIKIKLQHDAPATGHASPFIVFSDKKVESFNYYINLQSKR